MPLYTVAHVNCLGACPQLDYVTPNNSSVTILTSSTSECDRIWGQGLWRGNRVAMGSWESALIQRDWCPHVKGTFVHRRGTAGKQSEAQGEDSHLEARKEGLKPEPSFLTLRRNQPCWRLYLGLRRLQNCETINLCCSNRLVCGPVLQQPQNTDAGPMGIAFFQLLVLCIRLPPNLEA